MRKPPPSLLFVGECIGDLALNEIPGANHSSLPGKPAFGRFIDEWKGSFYLEFLIWISARSEIRR